MARADTRSTRGSGPSHFMFRMLFRSAPTGMMHWLRARGIGTLEELVVLGRRTGQEHRLLVNVFRLRGNMYVGHPNGDEANWVRNLVAADSAVVHQLGQAPLTVRPHRLPPGAERDEVIIATARLQPLPASLVYRLGRRHILRFGSYFRLEPDLEG
jgi:hypothetical protein